MTLVIALPSKRNLLVEFHVEARTPVRVGTDGNRIAFLPDGTEGGDVVDAELKDVAEEEGVTEKELRDHLCRACQSQIDLFASCYLP